MKGVEATKMGRGGRAWGKGGMEGRATRWADPCSCGVKGKGVAARQMTGVEVVECKREAQENKGKPTMEEM